MNFENNKYYVSFVRFGNRFRYYDYNTLKSFLKFWIIFLGVLFFILLLILQTVQIRIFYGEQDSSFLWLLLNALVWNVYLNSLGIFHTGIRKKTYKYVILVICILVILLGFGYFDINFIFNLWILNHKTFSTSSPDAIYFFWTNIHLWIPIYFITFAIESETTIEDY
jgi:hypothetical protein